MPFHNSLPMEIVRDSGDMSNKPQLKKSENWLEAIVGPLLDFTSTGTPKTEEIQGSK